MWTLTRLTILRPVSAPATRDRDLRADRRRQDRVALALAERLRARGEDPVAVSADALQVYAGPRDRSPASPGREERARLEHRLVAFLPVDRAFSAGAYAGLAHAEIDAAARRGRRPIVVGGTGLYLRAALAELDLRPPPPPGSASAGRPSWPSRARRRCTRELAARAPRPPRAIAPSDRAGIVRALELLDGGRRAAARPAATAAVDRRHAPSDAAGRPRHGPRRRSTSGSTRRVDAMVAAGAVDEVRARRTPPARRETARKALGFEELLAGDVEAMKRRTRHYAKRQLTWMRKLPGVELVDVTGRDGGGRRERDCTA